MPAMVTINPAHLVVGTALGKGQFKSVYSGRYRHRDVAVVQFASGDQSSELSILQKLAALSYQFVPQVYGMCKRNGAICIVQELARYGTVKDNVRKQPEMLPALIRLAIASQISQAMAFLEEEHIVHADLSCRNVLCFNLGQNGSDVLVKLSDFGLSIELDTEETAEAHTPDFFLVPQGAVTECRRQPRAVRWSAPESVAEHKFSHQSDVWSLGATIWESFSRSAQEPWSNFTKRDDVAARLREIAASRRINEASAVRSQWMDYLLLEFPRDRDCPVAVHDVVLTCMHADEFARPTLLQVAQRMKALISCQHDAAIDVAEDAWVLL